MLNCNQCLETVVYSWVRKRDQKNGRTHVKRFVSRELYDTHLTCTYKLSGGDPTLGRDRRAFAELKHPKAKQNRRQVGGKEGRKGKVRRKERRGGEGQDELRIESGFDLDQGAVHYGAIPSVRIQQRW